MKTSSVRVIGTFALVLGFFTAALAMASSDVADAAMSGNKAALRKLIQQRFDVNLPQADGATAIHWAVYKDDLEAADLLIHAGAKVHQETAG